MTARTVVTAAVFALVLAASAHGCASHTTDTTGHTGPVPLQQGRAVYDGDGMHVECAGPTPEVIRPSLPANSKHAARICAELAHDFQLLQSAVNGASR